MLQKIVQSFRQKMFFFGLWRRRVEWKIPSSFNKSRTFDLWLIVQTLYINPRMYTQIHTPTVVQGGVNEPPPPRVFDMLQYFKTIVPSVESFWSSLQDKVYFMGGGAAGGPWRHQQWSSSRPPSWISPRIRNQVKTARNGVFDMKNNT